MSAAPYHHGIFPAKAGKFNLNCPFVKQVKGKSNVAGKRIPGFDRKTPLRKYRLRLRKKKYTYEAWVQVSGKKWVHLGTHKLLRFTAPRLLLRQYNVARDTTEVEVLLKRVEIRAVR